MIRIGNYVIYPAFFIAFFIFLICVIIIIKTYQKISSFRDYKKLERFSKITPWQKKNIPFILKENIEESEKQDNYTVILEKIIAYIKKNKYWNPDELIEIHPKSIVLVSSLLYDEIKNTYLVQKDINKTVLLLHCLDYINGGVEIVNGKSQWISEEVGFLRNNTEMTDEEAQLFYLYKNAILNTYFYFDEDLNKIPESEDVEECIKPFSEIEYENALIDINRSFSVSQLTVDTIDLVSKCLINDISIIISLITTSNNINIIDDDRKAKIRAFASIIDKSNYSDIVKSIEY